MTHDFKILDGGMGRYLQAMGAPYGRPEWSALALMEAPDYVTRAHCDFIEAGARILTVNTYAIVPFHIGNARFKEDGERLIETAITCARDARTKSGKEIQIAGCLPPLFGSYRPDLFDPAQARDVIAPLINGQKEAVGFWLIETISSLEEAYKMVSLLQDKSSDKPVYLSLTLKDEVVETSPRPPTLRSGEVLSDISYELLELPLAGLMFNCTSAEGIEAALKIISAHNKNNIELGAYANAFTPIPEDYVASEGNQPMRDDLSPAQYLNFARKWQAAGANIIGGCCGIGPDHIRALNTLNR